MTSVTNNQPLAHRTVLTSPSVTGELASEVERLGARVATWPTLDSGPCANDTPLNEAIENLFGYDWLIFRNFNAADFFLRRFHELDRDISELDALRVCAIGEETTRRLDEAQIHIDVNPNMVSSAAAFAAIETYAGGRDAVPGLNFLIPRAAIADDSLTRTIEDAGGRADEVITYRTCSADSTELAQLKALLTGDGIDCVAFADPSEIVEFAAVFDTNDLQQLLGGTMVACLDERTAKAASKFGLRVNIASTEPTILTMAREISAHLYSSGP
jgi:uroporphyrinogen III methyltransferase/synthase